MRRSAVLQVVLAIVVVLPAAGQHHTLRRLSDLSLSQLKEADKQTVRDLDGLGPQNLPISLVDLSLRGLESFPEVAGLQSIGNLGLEVYPDANPDSGLYYYLPARYFLKWDADTGYHLAIDYAYERETGNNVVIDARLSPGPLQRDRQLLKGLLETYLQEQGRPLPTDREIRLLEVPATYEVVFDWSTLGVPETELAVTGIDRTSREIALTLTTDVGTRELLLARLSGTLGLVGEVTLTPEAVSADAPGLPRQSIQARLQLTDPAYASTGWQRATGAYSTFRNSHLFPVRLKYLCYLYRATSGLDLRGYDLGETRLEPGQVAKLPNREVDREIDDGRRVLKSWYVYSLLGEEPYREEVLAQLTGGVGSVPIRHVSIDVLSSDRLFEQYQLYKLLVLVRSRFFDPRGSEEITNTYEFQAGDSGTEIAPLFVPDRLEEPLFTYRIGIVTQAGEERIDTDWRRPGELEDIFIGSPHIEEVMAR